MANNNHQNSDKIINGLVFRNKEQYFLLSFFSENLYEIFEDQYMEYDGTKQPLPIDCFVLVHFDQYGRNHYKTFPITESRMVEEKEDGQKVQLKPYKLSIDKLIKYGFSTASKYLKERKVAQ